MRLPEILPVVVLQFEIQMVTHFLDTETRRYPFPRPQGPNSGPLVVVLPVIVLHSNLVQVAVLQFNPLQPAILCFEVIQPE
jgi:hypothetical protein